MIVTYWINEHFKAYSSYDTMITELMSLRIYRRRRTTQMFQFEFEYLQNQTRYENDAKALIDNLKCSFKWITKEARFLLAMYFVYRTYTQVYQPRKLSY